MPHEPEPLAVTFRVVYYGPPGAGKTTNLERIASLIRGSGSGRLTPRRVGENRLVSVEVPVGSLGRLFEKTIIVRLETLQGEVSRTDDGWSRALVDADGIVFVADSLPHARAANFKALAGIRERLEHRGRSGASTPILMQWNKRDAEDARTIADMETELNYQCFPSVEAASLRGAGVAETLIEIVKRTVNAARLRAGGTALADADLGQAVSDAVQRLSRLAQEASIDRFGTTIELTPSAWPEVREPATRHPGSSVAWSREPVYSDDSATRMLSALERATSALGDPNVSGLPHDLMAGLLAGCDRSRGSLLLFRPGSRRMDECEVVPAGSDPLNAPQPLNGSTRAATFCAGRVPVTLDDSIGLAEIRGAVIVPLVFGARTFGGMFVYVTGAERPPTAAERGYWKTAAALASGYLAWQAGEKQAVDPRPAQTGRASIREPTPRTDEST